MEINDYLERIHLYLSGELNKEEKKKFENDLESDPELKKAYLLEKKLVEGVKSYGRDLTRDKIRKIDEKLGSEGYFKKKNNSQRIISITMKRAISIAAAVVLVLVGTWFILRDNGQSEPLASEEIFEQYYNFDQDQLDNVIKDLTSYGFAGGETAHDTLKAALELQKRGEYQESCRLLDDFLTRYPQNDTAMYYLGIGYLNAEKYGKAVQVLSEVARMDDSRFEYDAKWNLALSYLMVVDGREEAVAIMRSLSEDPDYANQDDAKGMLDLLE